MPAMLCGTGLRISEPVGLDVDNVVGDYVHVGYEKMPVKRVGVTYEPLPVVLPVVRPAHSCREE